ncbi:uncharacterized protein LOC124172966 [Ischnura elegans]|uniref:uncharacterized protein LOC124172966 n=1 Tax=Ischnura elegans TaxID=197161 RepID=UPI001ED8AAA5|nr:uncharacterized protein LOC124172966 [Ischnura elegans]
MAAADGKYFVWSLELTEKFVRTRKEKAELFDGSRNSAVTAWSAIIKELELEGKVGVSQCRKKWDNLCKKYKDIRNPVTGSGREGGGESADTWPLYAVMHWALSERDAVSPPCLFISSQPQSPGSLQDGGDGCSLSSSASTSSSSDSPQPPKRRRRSSSTREDALERLVASVEEAVEDQKRRGDEFLNLFRSYVENKK